MQLRPRVSIVMPVYNDEEWVAAALRSCMNQSVAEIEIICVDDASTDSSCEIIERARMNDSRITLIRQSTNRSAFQARRAGIFAATAPYVMFLDGDDELALDAVAAALAAAEESGADVVGFGVDVVVPEGVTVGRFASDMQPRHSELTGKDIISGLFPVGKIAQGHLWRYLWNVDLLLGAYAGIDEDLELYRANDIPVAFLALALAEKYISIEQQLYRYYWRRGVSGRAVDSVSVYEFYLGALDSIDSIRSSVDRIGLKMDDATGMRESYHSARLSIIQMILRYCTPIVDDELRAKCYAMLAQRAGAFEVLLAVSTFYREALPIIAEQVTRAPVLGPNVSTVLITAGNLGSGGVQGVVASQAKHLVDAGFRVVVGARTLESQVQKLPDGVELVEISGATTREKLVSFMGICRDYDIDAVIDHYILYYQDWPYFALAARDLSVPVIGWIHNFALRPVFDFNSRSSYLSKYLGLLSTVVVLSPTDVAFWKLRGVENVVFLPNPASPLLLKTPTRAAPRQAPRDRIRIVWWGRLQQHTKRVKELVDVAASLRAIGVEFKLTIIGPNSGDLTMADVADYAARRGVADAVDLVGTLHGEALRSAINQADVFMSTSVIEGYPLVLIEAQAMGLPVAMYELPWLAAVRENEGVLTSPQQQPRELARRIAALVEDPDEYTRRSAGSIAAARRTMSHDFGDLYTQLLMGTLPRELSPEPSFEDAKLLLNLSIDFHEHAVDSEGKRFSEVRFERDRERRYARRLRGKIDGMQRQLDAEHLVATERELRIAKLVKRVGRSKEPASIPAHLAAERASEPWPVRAVRPAGRAVLRLVPSLRPLARRVNRLIGRR